MTLFGVDAASFQGTVDWPKVAESISFGFEKVSQGSMYLNPRWTASRTALASLLKDGKFVPGAYMFLEHGNAAAQVDYFAKQAGDLTGWLIAIDAEPTTGSNPLMSDLSAAVEQMRSHYPNHLIGGYLPQWYWGSPSFSMFDWLWASKYVTGSGTITELFDKVPGSFWDSYGGLTPSLLQFSAAASVSGVTGQCDADAFRGTFAELRNLVAKATSTGATTTEEDDVQVLDLPKGKAYSLPVPSGSNKVELYADQGASIGGVVPVVRVGTYPHWVVSELKPEWGKPGTMDLTSGTTQITLSRQDDGETPVTVNFS